MRRAGLFFICIAAAAAIVAGCGREKREGFLGSGTLEAIEVTVSAQTPGQILRLAVDEGDSVSAGDVLAEIDVEKLELQRRQLAAGLDEVRASRKPAAEAVKQAEEQLANIEKSYERITSLFQAGSASQQQFDDISTKRSVARSQLETARSQKNLLDAKERQIDASIALLDRQIRDGRVTAPVGGVVTEKYVERGEIVPAGGAVVKIADVGGYWIKVYVSERDLGAFKIGEAARVEVDALKAPVEATITWVSAEAEFTPKNVETRDARAELVYAVKVTLTNPPPELKIGMPAEVYLAK